MKKFGRQAQYYTNTNNQSNEKDILNNNPEIEYEDPVDLEFMNEFTKKSNTKIKNKSNIKNKNIFEETKDKQEKENSIYNTPKFNTNSFSSSYTRTKNNNTSTNIRYVRLSELDDTNPYNCLEVSQMATQEEIRNAYKRLIFLNHPDKGGDGEKFNKIHEAYEILRNPITKSIIDTFGSISFDLVKNILINDLLGSKQLVDEINFCVKQNDFTQLFILINNIRN
jgi:hypothetical protein